MLFVRVMKVVLVVKTRSHVIVHPAMKTRVDVIHVLLRVNMKIFEDKCYGDFKRCGDNE